MDAGGKKVTLEHAYKLYCRTCQRIGVQPAAFQAWLAITGAK